MTFLPPFDRLSVDQDDVLALPPDASAIVIGPPGSGKTVLALYRARVLRGAGEPTLLLMYNRLLSTYTTAAVSALNIGSVVDTYHNWFSGFWRRNYRSAPPKSGKWTFDWTECKRIIMSQPLPADRKIHIIVDEGQDMPSDFYLVLRLVCRSMLVFADEHQRITDQQSTIAEIRAASGIRQTLVLRRNLRNTREIAEFAAHFHLATLSEATDLAGLASSGERPVLIAHPDVRRAVDHLVSYERSHGKEKIGVLLPLVENVRQYYNRLSGKTRNAVQLYLSKIYRRTDDREVDMSSPGIKLVTWASCKGLEFDSVFLPELQSVNGDPADDGVRMKLYVACTRARRSLTLMYAGEGEPALVNHLPLALLHDAR